MIVLMFQPRFAPLVESGKKRQTIRPTRKRPIKTGDRLSLRTWTGKPYRSKQQYLLTSVVTRTQRIEIWTEGGIIAIDGQRLDFDRMLNMAQADGFNDHWEM